MTAHIKNTVGIHARVKAVAPDTLERSLGKAKRVFDKRLGIAARETLEADPE